MPAGKLYQADRVESPTERIPFIRAADERLDDCLTYVSSVAEIYLGPFFPSHRLDFRIFFLEPLLHQSLVAFDRTVQWLLAGDAELRQQTPYRIGAQCYAELVLDELGHHLAGPQRKHELQLQRILLGHHIVNPLQLLAVQLRRTPEQWFGLQRAPAAAPVFREPPVNSRAPDPEYPRYHFGTFAFLHTPHRAFAQRFQGRMIQLASIMFSHATKESRAIHTVKKMFPYLWPN